MSLKFRAPWIMVVATSLLVATAAVAQNKSTTQKDARNQNDPTKQNRSATQNTRQQPNVVTTRKVPSQTSSPQGDAQIAACLVIENHHEAALGQFASQKAQNAEVKDFAQRMVNDHEQFASQLQKFASAGGYNIQSHSGSAGRKAEQGRNANERKGATNRPDNERSSATEQDRNAGQTTTQRTQTTTQTEGHRASGEGLDFVAIKQEISDRCLQSTKQALEEKQADKFDKCYIGGQVMAHMAMIDAMEVLKNHSSGDLSQVIADGIKTAQSHLDEAKQLEKNLESERAGSPNRSAQQNKK